jgi:hypothetical protein
MKRNGAQPSSYTQDRKRARQAEQREQMQYALDVAQEDAQHPLLRGMLAEKRHCNALTAMLRAAGDTTSMVTPQNDWYDIQTQGERLCVCDPTGQTTHKQTNASLIVDATTGHVRVFCFADRCPVAADIGILLRDSGTDTLRATSSAAKISEATPMPQADQREKYTGRGTMPDNTPPRRWLQPVGTEASLAQNRLQTYQQERTCSTVQRKTTTVRTKCRRIHDEPSFDVNTQEGAKLRALWKDNVVVANSYQGSGKTYWLNRAIINQLRQFPLSKIVYISPFTTLTEAAAARLRSALAAAVEEGLLTADHGFVVRQYREYDKCHEDWNVLVCHPRSLKHWSFRGVTMIAIDEVTSMLFQIGSWDNMDDATRQSINGCTDLLQKLYQQAHWLLLSCAQLNDEHRETLCTLLSVSPEAEVIHYAHDTPGPRIPVVLLTSEHVIRSRIWADVLAGRRVAVSVRHAKEAHRMNKWLKKEVQMHNVESRERNAPIIFVPSVAWTAEWCQSRDDAPASDATGWLTCHNIQVMFYTNSLSPGMSIDHSDGYWYRVYMHVGNKGGGASSMVMGQMAQRIRKPEDVILYMYVQQMPSSKSRSSSSASIVASTADRAMKAVLAEHPQERELYLDAHSTVIAGLKSGKLNDVRLEYMYEKLATGNVIHAADIVKHMGNAHIVSTDTSTEEPSPCWLEVLAEEQHVIQTLHLCNTELPDISRCVDVTEIHTRIRPMQYNYIANTVPPEFITTAGYRNAHSLTHAAFEYIHGKYQQLQVVQRLARLNVRALLEDIDLYAHADQLSGKTGSYTVNSTSRAVATICALIAVRGKHADTAVLTNGLSMNMQVPATAAGSVVATASPDHSRRVATYGWIKENWAMIRTLPSRNLQLPKAAPHYDNTEQWTVCLQRIVKEHTGLNWRKPKHGTQYELTQLSMWSKLGIDVCQYVEWYNSPHATQFGIIEKTVQCCTECDGVGDDVRCLRQNNLWRCITRQTADSWPHRQPFDPLDVNAAWVVEPPAEPEAEHKQVEQQGQPASAVHATVLGRLLGHLGFTHGTDTDAPGVSHQDMALAWSKAVVTEEDRAATLLQYQLDLSPFLADRSHTQRMRTRVTAILQTMDLQLTTTRQYVNGEKLRMTYVATL